MSAMASVGLQQLRTGLPGRSLLSGRFLLSMRASLLVLLVLPRGKLVASLANLTLPLFLLLAHSQALSLKCHCRWRESLSQDQLQQRRSSH